MVQIKYFSYINFHFIKTNIKAAAYRVVVEKLSHVMGDVWNNKLYYTRQHMLTFIIIISFVSIGIFT